MDSDSLLANIRSVVASLRGFPRFQGVAECTEEYTTEREARKSFQRDVARCMPFTTQLIRVLNEHMSGYDEEYFRSVDARKAFVETKQGQTAGPGTARKRLVERLKNLQAADIFYNRIRVLSKEESERVIRAIHSEGVVFRDSHLSELMRHYVRLDYTPVGQGLISTLRRILAYVKEEK